MIKKHVQLGKSVLAGLLMLGGLTPFAGSAFAATLPSTDAPPTVSGWVQVSTASQLEYIDQNQITYLHAQIELLNSINLSGYTDWVPIGDENFPFSGTLNGQGYEIQNLMIDYWLTHSSASSMSYSGVFGVTTGTLEDIGVDATVSGGQYDGGLAGNLFLGTIYDSCAIGAVSGGTLGNGGVVGVQSSLDNNNNDTAFFDIDTTGQQEGIGRGEQDAKITGKTTQQLQTPSTLTDAGWSTSDWVFASGQYPALVDPELSNTTGQMPEVPFAGALPVLGIAGLSAWAYAKKRKG